MSKDFFKLLDMPRAFNLDENQLQRAYIEAQREAHPDRAIPSEKTQALQKSADINQAYHTLKSPLLRAEYLLRLHGIVVGSEKDSVKPSPELLMESMEMREALQAAEDVALLKETAETQREETLAAFARHYGEKNFPAAAQDALRLRYLEKFLEEVRVKKVIGDR